MWQRHTILLRNIGIHGRGKGFGCGHRPVARPNNPFRELPPPGPWLMASSQTDQEASGSLRDLEQPPFTFHLSNLLSAVCVLFVACVCVGLVLIDGTRPLAVTWNQHTPSWKYSPGLLDGTRPRSHAQHLLRPCLPAIIVQAVCDDMFICMCA